MRDLAPEITRQRLLIEGHYAIDVGPREVEGYLLGIAEDLGLRTYGTPIVHAPGGQGKAENEGFDAFVPLIDSGNSPYVCIRSRFFAALLFTCKTLDTHRALAYMRQYFSSEDAEYASFRKRADSGSIGQTARDLNVARGAGGGGGSRQASASRA